MAEAATILEAATTEFFKISAIITFTTETPQKDLCYNLEAAKQRSVQNLYNEGRRQNFSKIAFRTETPQPDP